MLQPLDVSMLDSCEGYDIYVLVSTFMVILLLLVCLMLPKQDLTIVVIHTWDAGDNKSSLHHEM